VESSQDAIIGKTLDGIITSWNLGAERLYGYSAEEVIGRPVSILVPNDRPNEVLEILERLKRGERVEQYETARVRKDGTRIDVSLRVSLIRDTTGKITGASAIACDITERKQAERALQRANEKLATWVNELERRSRETMLVNQMNDLLQSCLTTEEAYAVIGQCAPKLFAAESGALCMLNASVNLVEAVAVWGKTPVGERVFGPQECWALRRGQLYVVDHPRLGLLCQHLSQPVESGYLCVPMMAHGEALGVLHVQGSPHELSQPEETRQRLMESRQRLALAVAGHVALALANLKLRETLRLQSIRDPLTGLFNRRYMRESLERELRRAARNVRPLAVIMLDIDHFKRFNDTFGHEAGDVLLRALGSFLQRRTRGEDIGCRYGGDEFTLLLMDAPLEVARQRAEQLREAFKHLNTPYGEQILGPATLSAGVAVFPEHGSTGEDLLRAADQALYRAKAKGRDRVVIKQGVE